jgi:hypothetical protein
VSLCFGAVGLVVILIWMPRETGRHRPLDAEDDGGPSAGTTPVPGRGER